MTPQQTDRGPEKKESHLVIVSRSLPKSHVIELWESNINKPRVRPD